MRRVSKYEKLEGQVFNDLTVIEQHHNRSGGHIRYLCRCECGNETIVIACKLVSGHTKSCGCRRRKPYRQTHGESRTRLYKLWAGIKTRCYNSNSSSYDSYGAKGVRVCDEWLSDYESFKKWALENGYRDDLTIDRICGDSNYSPENCRWATYEQQSRNRNCVVLTEYDIPQIIKMREEGNTLKSIAEKYGVVLQTIHNVLAKKSWA